MTIETFHSIMQISKEDWRTICPNDFPFVSHEFLSALEVSDCLGSRTGWVPLYITIRTQGKLQGAIIIYLKNNSYGEFIFDFGWAHAYQVKGINYYPKIVSAVPFTPATGSKFLINQNLSEAEKLELKSRLLHAAFDFSNQIGASSFHAFFIPQEEIPFFEKAGLFIRHSYQFHWQNRDYKTFEDFTKDLRSKRRRELNRERTSISDRGIEILKLTGEELKPEHAATMYNFYLSTIQKMGGIDYLTKDFFKKVFTTMRDKVLFILARNKMGHEVAGALNLFGGSTLYGRYWGCLDEYRALHFELCYYQGIEFAIERRLKLFEAGAQGEHKFQRGFLPTLTYSAHQLKHSQLNLAIQDFVNYEKIQISHEILDFSLHSPFQRSP